MTKNKSGGPRSKPEKIPAEELHRYPVGNKMKKGSKLQCLGCRGKNPNCAGCEGKGFIKV